MSWQIIKRQDTQETERGDRYNDWLSGSLTPPWRPIDTDQKSFDLGSPSTEVIDKTHKGSAYIIPPLASVHQHARQSIEERLEATIDLINFALLLRKPLLVTGSPGIGKSALAYHLAQVLGLGDPLVWPIHSESTLQDGLYHYDAIGHLHHAQMQSNLETTSQWSINDFISLGPLGEALRPWTTPRVLLIDEIDKSSYHLPNDLLNALEEGSFEIEELKRARSQKSADSNAQAQSAPQQLPSLIRMNHPPLIIMTSNQDREFPEAFLRRCVHLELGRPSIEMIKRIIFKHFQHDSTQHEHLSEHIEQFFQQDDPSQEIKHSTDVLIQSFFLNLKGQVPRTSSIPFLKR